jgi:hypothetical protein
MSDYFGKVKKAFVVVELFNYHLFKKFRRKFFNTTIFANFVKIFNEKMVLLWLLEFLLQAGHSIRNITN